METPDGLKASDPAMDCLVAFRRDLRQLLHDNGIGSNPGWTEADIIDAFRKELTAIRGELEQVKTERDLLNDQGVQRFLHKGPEWLKLEEERDSLQERLAVAVGALTEIADREGMTNLGSCCVDKICQEVWDDGEKIAHCAFSFGVNRGFNTSAADAREALAKIGEKA
jgi:hypothetical protein